MVERCDRITFRHHRLRLQLRRLLTMRRFKEFCAERGVPEARARTRSCMRVYACKYLYKNFTKRLCIYICIYIYFSVWSDAWSCLGRDIQDYDELPLCLCSSSRISRSSHSSSAFRRSDNAKEEVEVCIAAWPLFLPIPSPINPTKSSKIWPQGDCEIPYPAANKASMGGSSNFKHRFSKAKIKGTFEEGPGLGTAPHLSPQPKRDHTSMAACSDRLCSDTWGLRKSRGSLVPIVRLLMFHVYVR